MSIMQIEEFFYARAASRIRDKVKASGLKYSEIYKPDPKQISRIVNNQRTKNNRFLICNAVIETSYKEDETGKYIGCGLLATPKLGFKNQAEILWGTNTEFSAYLYDLFLILWQEISESSSYHNIDTELYLCDYVPYAKYSSYFDILFNSDNKYPAIFYGIKEDTIIENLLPSKDKALEYLFKRCEKQFLREFQSFTQKKCSFSKLDKTIKHDLIPIFIQVLESHKPNSTSLGIRVRDLIRADLIHCASLVLNKTETDTKYHASLISASEQYIRALEKIQAENIL